MNWLVPLQREYEEKQQLDFWDRRKQKHPEKLNTVILDNLKKKIQSFLSYGYGYFSATKRKKIKENWGKQKKKYLRAAFATVGAANELDVAAAVLVATTIPSLERLQKHNYQKNRWEMIASKIEKWNFRGKPHHPPLNPRSEACARRLG